MGLKAKIEKLEAHERSARQIGNIGEADNYKRKIDRLQKLAAAEPASERVAGKWKCSCGFSISLDIDAGALSRRLADVLLAPHRLRGHKLTQIDAV